MPKGLGLCSALLVAPALGPGVHSCLCGPQKGSRSPHLSTVASAAMLGAAPRHAVPETSDRPESCQPLTSQVQTWRPERVWLVQEVAGTRVQGWTVPAQT